jgi:hypothetical protein
MVLKLGTLLKVDQKYLEGFEMWCWRRSVGPINVRNEEVLYCIESKGNEHPTYNKKRRKTKWIGHILRRNCLLKHVIEGNTDRSDWKKRKTT